MSGNGDDPRKKIGSSAELAVKFIGTANRYAAEHGFEIPQSLRDIIAVSLATSLAPTYPPVTQLTLDALLDLTRFMYWLGYIAHADPELIGLEPSKSGGDDVISTG